MDVQKWMETAQPLVVAFGLKVLGAIVAYIVGRMLIGFASGLVIKAMQRQKVDPTIIRYIGSVITVALNIILVVAILGYFGVETTSFAALKTDVAHLQEDVAALKATVAQLRAELGSP